MRNAINTIFNAKRLIGRSIDDPAVSKDIEGWPFDVKSDDEGRTMVVVNFKGEEREFYIEQLSAMVLAKIKKYAEDHY